MKRVVTALVGIPLVLLATFYSPDWLFALLIAVFAALCFEELLAISRDAEGRPGRWVIVPGAIVTASFLGGAEWVLTTLTLSLIIALSVSAFTGSLATSLHRFGIIALGLVYCCVLLGFMVLLSRQEILVLFSIIWAGDSAAYYGGRALGRHKLATKISPKKTVEGAVAGLIASIVAGIGIGGWLLGESTTDLFIVALLAAIAGQVGDLVESALKRSAGVKDSSAILPGHGGILDRLDSLLFAAPVFYLFFNL
jgi:phosphatidate cytidylyltransferase